jgi:hypothetical protein
MALRAAGRSARRVPFLPGKLNDMFEPLRDYAHIRLPTSGHPTLAAFSPYGRTHLGTHTHTHTHTQYVSQTSCGGRGHTSLDAQQLMIATSEGAFYQYLLDVRNGGECSLLQQFRCAVTASLSACVCVPNSARIHSFLDAADPAERPPGT